MKSFNQRYGLSDIIVKNVGELFNPEDVEIVPFGFENITNENKFFSDYIKTTESNMSYSSMLVKFAPDFIMLKKSKPQEIYFLEIKASKTPLRFYSRFNELQSAYPRRNLKLSDIGDIAREAWNAYYNLFPNTIIIDGCSYNPKVLMAQFVDKIECLMCRNPLRLQACANCPVKARKFFDFEVNGTACGSGTPHTNINYSSFDYIEDFFDKLNIRLNTDIVENIKLKIKNSGVYFPENTDEQIKQKVLTDLRTEGCNWL